VCIANEEDKSNVCFEPPMPILQLKKRNPMWVLKPHAGIEKKGKNPMCVLRLYASIVFEEKKFSMYFANDMQKFHTLY